MKLIPIICISFLFVGFTKPISVIHSPQVIEPTHTNLEIIEILSQNPRFKNGIQFEAKQFLFANDRLTILAVPYFTFNSSHTEEQRNELVLSRQFYFQSEYTFSTNEQNLLQQSSLFFENIIEVVGKNKLWFTWNRQNSSNGFIGKFVLEDFKINSKYQIEKYETPIINIVKYYLPSYKE